MDKLAEKYVIPKMTKIVEATAKQTMQNVWWDVLGWWAIDPQLLETMNGGVSINTPTAWATQTWVAANKKRNLPKVNLTPQKLQEIKEILWE
jgi:hypothetical protein